MTVNKAELWDIAKRNIGVLIVGTVFLILYFSGCGPRRGDKTENRSDTVTHTTQVVQPIVVNPPYTPQQVGKTTYVTIPTSAQGVIPASTVEGLIEQVKDLSKRIEELGRQYYAIKHYEDSIQLKDTAGTRVGVVKLKQRVSENTLQETQPTYQLSFPHTVTTITNTVYEKPRNQVYAGIGVQTFLNNPNIQQVSLGLMFKNKTDNMIGVSGIYDFPNKSPGIQLHYFKKITFKKPTLTRLL